MGPPSSGGSTVGEALNILEGYNLASMTREAALHYYLEASRYSFADRNAYLADPAYFDVPLTGLLSDEYAATRRALIKATAAPGLSRLGSVSVRGRGDDHPSRRRTSPEPSSRTRSRSNRPAARDSSSRATGSCSTTS